VLPDWVRPGAKFRYEPHPSRHELHHVRAIVDDDVVVLRRWIKTKNRWHYWIEQEVWFEVAARDMKPIS
jgi:hypothetical protein